MTTHHQPSKAFDSKTFTETMAEVTQNVEEFLTNGVYVHHEDWRHRENDTYWPHFNRRRFMRAIAKEHNRPFITARRITYPNYVTGVGVDEDNPRTQCRVVLPKRKYLRPLMSALLLVAEEGPRPYSRDCPAIVSRGATINTFTFNGDEGRAHFENWLHQCRTNPEFRKALRLQ